MNTINSIIVAELASAGHLKININKPSGSETLGSAAWLIAQPISASFHLEASLAEFDWTVYVAELELCSRRYLIAAHGARTDGEAAMGWIPAEGVQLLPLECEDIIFVDRLPPVTLTLAARTVLHQVADAVRREFEKWTAEVNSCTDIKIELVDA